MVPSDRTLFGALAFRELFFRVFAHVVSAALFFVARLAEVSVAPTKPLSYAAAEFAFEFNEVFAMFWTILNRNVTTI